MRYARAYNYCNAKLKSVESGAYISPHSLCFLEGRSGLGTARSTESPAF